MKSSATAMLSPGIIFTDADVVTQRLRAAVGGPEGGSGTSAEALEVIDVFGRTVSPHLCRHLGDK